MSDIDFQNGLVVGMTLAGKNGLVGTLTEIGGGQTDTFYGTVDPGITIFFADTTFYGEVVSV
ncbi:MAG: hypothetical protein FIA99_05445 [Ruminiclostridium sp.]|nr:hypothetical protein [Ruminiclostridium sp.]